ncbi:MAG: hypothetical protein Fur005_43200 [Roseiflexaceae bacterium]
MPRYSDLRDHNQEVLRRSVVAAAEELLLHHGAEAVTVRRVAQQLDCSTTVIYNLFGSKDGLANALYLEGCHRMQAALAAVVPSSDPRRTVEQLAWAYWEFAHNNPAYYTLMFSGAIPEFKPDPTSMHDLQTAIGLSVAILETYRQQGVLAIDDSVQVAMMIWTALHGVVQLFFAGHLGDAVAARALYARSITMVLHYLFPAI